LYVYSPQEEEGVIQVVVVQMEVVMEVVMEAVMERVVVVNVSLIP
jgi:hypothetical protein